MISFCWDRDIFLEVFFKFKESMPRVRIFSWRNLVLWMTLWLQLVFAAPSGKSGLLCPLQFSEDDTTAICEHTSSGIYTCCEIALSYALAQHANISKEFYLSPTEAENCLELYSNNILPKFLSNGKCKSTQVVGSPLRTSILAAKSNSCLQPTSAEYKAYVDTATLSAACPSGPMTGDQCRACGQEILSISKSPECLMAAQVYLGSQSTSVEHWNLLSACIQSNFGVPIPSSMVLPPSPSPPPAAPPHSNRSSPSLAPGIIGGSAGGLVLILLVLLFLFWWRCGREAQRRRSLQIRRANLSKRSKRSKAMIQFKEFPLEELQAATLNFDESTRIGKGGSSDVYQGVLPDGSVVAIKKMLRDTSVEGYAASQFVTEVTTYSVLQHENLVKLFGFCQEGDELILVQEYMRHGSLEDALFSGESDVDVSWPMCMNVVLGVARGLAYLHGSPLGANPATSPHDRIIHRDIKPGNVLLDDHYVVRLADFGVAKSMVSKQTHVTTKIMGTFGYLAPEYASTGKLTEKSDVYSFGVLLLVTVSKRQPIDDGVASLNVGLVPAAFKLARDNRLLDLVDISYRGQYTSDQAERLLLVGLLCVQPDPTERPCMNNVLAMLEGTADVPEVPIPTIQAAARIPGLQRLHGPERPVSETFSLGATTDSRTFSPASTMLTEWDGSGEINRNNDDIQAAERH